MPSGDKVSKTFISLFLWPFWIFEHKNQKSKNKLWNWQSLIILFSIKSHVCYSYPRAATSFWLSKHSFQVICTYTKKKFRGGENRCIILQLKKSISVTMATRDLQLVLWLIFVIINNTAKYENKIFHRSWETTITPKMTVRST